MSTSSKADVSVATASQGSTEKPAHLDKSHEGFPPQAEGTKYPVNTARPGAAFYTPWTHPSSGTALKHAAASDPSKSLPLLFQPLTIRGREFKNRIWVSPMCQYSAEHNTGMPNDWHLVHQGQFSIKGAALTITEASSVLDNGGITPEDLGIWSDEHIPAFKRIVDFHHSQGALAGIQLAHAGRKSSTPAPWLTDGLVARAPFDVSTHHVPEEAHGWKDVWAPSAIKHNNLYPKPVEMSLAQIKELVDAFGAATHRAIKAGYDVIELHGAHGYLLHNFLSPASNKRTDKYGGSLENRNRLLVEVAQTVRSIFDGPLFVRISASDWSPDGEKNAQGEYTSWGVEQSIVLAKSLKAVGVDLIDVSSGGLLYNQQIDIGPGYQVPFAEALKKESSLDGLLIGSVGLITEPQQAEDTQGKADVVLLAREFLRHADFVIDAAYHFGIPVSVPVQYQRAHTRMFKPKH